MRGLATVAALSLSAALAGAADTGFKSSGRYDAALTIRLAGDTSTPLVGQRTIAVEISGASVKAVKFYIDGELAGTDESAPYETRFDFGPTPRRHELVIVATTPSGTKSKRIFATDAEARLGDAVGPPAMNTPAAPPPPPASPPSSAPSAPAAGEVGSVTRRSDGDLSVVILEPWGGSLTGTQSIVIDARARKPHRIARVEIIVDGKVIARLTAPPWQAEYDFGPDPRPREVKAVAYDENGDAASATWQSAGAPPTANLVESDELRVRLVSPKEGDYLAGPVTLEADVTASPESPVSRVDFFVDGSLVGSADKAPFKVTWDAGAKVLSHTVKVYAYDRNGRRAQSQVSTKPLAVAFTEDVKEVVLTASFTYRQGRPVADLRQDEIEVREDGKVQPITGFKPEARPIVIALVVDASGSMAQKLAQTKIAAAQFVDQLADEDRAIVISFSQTVNVRCEATGDKAKLKQAIDAISVETSTALYDALATAEEKVQAAVAAEGDARRAIVVLSDGEDSGPGGGGSTRTYAEVEKTALQKDIRVYCIDITRAGPSFKALGGSPFSRVQSNVLQGLSDQTGGQAFFVDSVGELSRTYGQVADELRRQYWITYRPTNTKKDGKWREIEVSGKDRKLIVRTRAGYYGKGSS